MSRGVNRQRIFAGDDDHKLFINILAHTAVVHRLNVLSYCLMPNHIHLYVSTPEANLSRAMQVLLATYALHKNRRDMRSGHLFQGRFLAHLIDEPGYGNVISRYVHLNPVKGKIARQMPMDERRRLLHDYPWSSYGAIIGLRPCPSWLDRESVLRVSATEPLGQCQKRYAGYVEQGLSERYANPFSSAAAQCILGTDDFVDMVRRMYVQCVEGLNRRRELPQSVKLGRWIGFEDLLAAVARAYDCDPAVLQRRGGYRCEARQAMIHLSWKLCRGRYSLTELSDRLGISAGGLNASRHVFFKMLIKKHMTAQKITQIDSSLAI
jgi:REP element-mobilizing transposase RayT